jgi:tetratricopeptide (TPR) repeat protein
LLSRLADAYLVEEQTPGRYGMHDLLRLYAAQRATTEHDQPARTAALERLLDHYMRSVAAAARVLYPDMVRLPLPDGDGDGAAAAAGLDDHARAAAWLDAERSNLVAAITHAARNGARSSAWRLADAFRGYLFLRTAIADWSLVARAGLAAAEGDRDPRAQAASHLSVATLHWVRGRAPDAITHFTLALSLAREGGWDEGEAAALGNLGNVQADLGRLSEAADHYTRALEVERRTGRHAASGICRTGGRRARSPPTGRQVSRSSQSDPAASSNVR